MTSDRDSNDAGERSDGVQSQPVGKGGDDSDGKVITARSPAKQRPRVGEIEILERRKAFRRFLVMGTIAWTAFILTDFIAAKVYTVPLEYLIAVRLTGTGIALTMYLLVGVETLPQWAFEVLEGGMAPLAGFFVSLDALRCGGANSPLMMGVATCALIRGVLPTSWRRALLSTLACAMTFPITILVASTWRAEVAAQLDDRVVLWTFIQGTVFLALGAGAATAGSHLLWSAKEQIHQARKLGAYRLVARIGTGGMGEVWLARQMPLNRPVALKILKESTLRDPAALRRFRREAEAASSLSHPHTIRVFDFGASDDGVFFIAMELLDGMDLEAIVDQTGPLLERRVIHLGRQICGSLAEAHKRGIIHCDLKPANLFVTKVGDEYDFAKVLDFGLARIIISADHATVDSMRGTPAFMPPEVINAEPVTAASDVYSMGAVLYWMITGTPVFQGKGFHESVMAHLEQTPERPSDRVGHAVAADLEAVILKCLSKTRAERFPDAASLEQALAACADADKWTTSEARVSWEELRPSLGTIPARKV